MCRRAASAPGPSGSPGEGPPQAAQRKTPCTGSSRASAGSAAPQTAQPSASGSYPARLISRSSKAGLASSRGFFSVSSAYSPLSRWLNSSGAGISGEETASVSSAK